MKKFIYLFLAVTMTVFLFGCGEDNTTNDTTQGGQSMDGIVIEPAPKDNVITLTPDSNGEYSITFKNATLNSGNPKDVFFQFKMIDDNQIDQHRFNNTRCKFDSKNKIVYGDFNTGPDGSHCTLTYTLKGSNKKDIKMDKFIATINDGNMVEPDLNNTKGETITIKHKDGQTTGSLDGLIIEPAPKDNVITLTPDSNGEYSIKFKNATLNSGNPKDVFFQFKMIDDNQIDNIKFNNTRCKFDSKNKIVYGDFNKGPDESHCTLTYVFRGPKKDIKMVNFISTINDGNMVEPDLNNTKGETITIKHN